MTDQRRRILIVDDYVDSLESWKLFFTMSGFEVLTAVDGEAAVQLVVGQRPDVVVLDLALPILTGVEAARQIRALPGMHRLPLIATTGYSGGNPVQAAQEAGFDRILIKPCDPGLLLAEVERLLAARFSTDGPPAAAPPVAPVIPSS